MESRSLDLSPVTQMSFGLQVKQNEVQRSVPKQTKLDGQTNVKLLMAKFNTGNSLTEEVSGPNRPFKSPGQPSGTPAVAAKKAALEHLANPRNINSTSGPPAFQKPGKPAFVVKNASEEESERDPKPPYGKPTSVVDRYRGSTYATNKEVEGQVGFARPHLKPTEVKKEDAKPPFPKSPLHKPLQGAAAQGNEYKHVALKPSLPTAQQGGKTKPAFPKPSEARAAFSPAQEENEQKHVFPKKPALEQKSSLIANASQNKDSAPTNALFPKGAVIPKTPKPIFLRHTNDPAESTSGSEQTSQPFPGVTLKPIGKQIQSPFLNQKAEESNEEKKPNFASKDFLKKVNEDNGCLPTIASKFPKLNSRFPSDSTASSQEKGQGEKGSDVPRRKALTPLYKLGPAPQKPTRPPNVDLEKFRKRTTGDSSSKGVSSKPSPSHTSAASAFPPPPLPSHPTTQAIPPPPPLHPTTLPPTAPILPPRNIQSAAMDLEESYDDVEFEGSSFNSNADGSEDNDEIYEGIDDNSSISTKEDEKRREKEEKKRQEQEKKEQKEKERKEQDIRKRFKLVGPIEVIHQAKACIDCKGGKNELIAKQGDAIEIIRITDNPEGKWLGRTKGNYGYIKTTSVVIDYDTLKRQQKASISGRPITIAKDQEVYDDVEEADSMSRNLPGNASGSFPPPPLDEDIYDGIDEEPSQSCVPQEEEKSWTWTLLKKMRGKDDKGKSAKDNESGDKDESFAILLPLPPQNLSKDADEGEVYDDVESRDFPPPPKELSVGMNIKSPTLGKSDEKEAKKLKKMEKEEKEFKKKFKYEGEINVIHSAKIISSLTTKKWGAKDLPLKPGETVEIIQNTDDTKVLCRNDEGKYGYVLRSNLDFGNDGEIYDDIAEGCIYDND